MNRRHKLMVEAQKNRTHDEQLRVIDRRVNHMQAAVDEVMNVALRLADQFELLKSDVEFYRSKWSHFTHLSPTPTVDPIRPVGQFSSREQPDWQDGFNKSPNTRHGLPG